MVNLPGPISEVRGQRAEVSMKNQKTEARGQRPVGEGFRAKVRTKPARGIDKYDSPEWRRLGPGCAMKRPMIPGDGDQ